MATGAGEVGRAGAHVIAKALEHAGVRDAERLSVHEGEQAGTRALERGARSEINDADRAALGDYTSHHYGEINSYNRNPASVSPSDAADLEGRSQAISDALGKLPPHEGTVLRGGTFPEDVLERYRPGETVREDAFTSTSTNRPFPGNVAMTIESKTGKSIEQYTVAKGENEVLFDRGTSFKVLSHDVREGVHYISMMEV